jgi:hypothetical protein
MVLIYENDPLDNEDARGRFYHVCRGESIARKLPCRKANRYMSVRCAGWIWSRKIFGWPGKRDQCSARASTESR